MIDPLKNFGNVLPYYELLQMLNPHLPDATFVATEPMDLEHGLNQPAVLTFSVYVTAPDVEKIKELMAQEREDTEMRATFAEDPEENWVGPHTRWPCGCLTMTPKGAVGPALGDPSKSRCGIDSHVDSETLA